MTAVASRTDARRHGRCADRLVPRRGSHGPGFRRVGMRCTRSHNRIVASPNAAASSFSSDASPRRMRGRAAGNGKPRIQREHAYIVSRGRRHAVAVTMSPRSRCRWPRDSTHVAADQNVVVVRVTVDDGAQEQIEKRAVCRSNRSTSVSIAARSASMTSAVGLSTQLRARWRYPNRVAMAGGRVPPPRSRPAAAERLE